MVGITPTEVIEIYHKNNRDKVNPDIASALAEAMTLMGTRVYEALTARLDAQVNKQLADNDHLTKSVTELFNICMTLAKEIERPTTSHTSGRGRVCYCGARVVGDKCEVCGRA